MTLPDVKKARIKAGMRVIVRAELNVPIENEIVVNDFRLARVRETVSYLHEQGARIVLLGHRGSDGSKTLRPVHEYFKKSLPIRFFDGPLEEARAEEEKLSEGEILLLENIRREKGELTNDAGFARALASLGEVYVNDAFSVSHRSHASIVGLPALLPSYAGIQFLREIEELSKALTPLRPALLILGGAKFETKLPLIQKYLDRYDRVFVAGALANDFFRAKGFPIGQSLVSELSIPPEVLENGKLLLPVDMSVQSPSGVSIKRPEEIAEGDMMVDIGPETSLILQGEVDKARFVLWNGPLGAYEEGYSATTEALAKVIASSEAASIVGGGDTIGAIGSLGLEEKFTFLSTGGGAMLEFLEKETLPGIEALKQAKTS